LTEAVGFRGNEMFVLENLSTGGNANGEVLEKAGHEAKYISRSESYSPATVATCSIPII
jgi:hypothetical protein